MIGDQRRQPVGNVDSQSIYRYEVTFEERETAPVPVRRHRALGDIRLDERYKVGQPYKAEFATPRGTWQAEIPREIPPASDSPSERMWPPVMVARMASELDQTESIEFLPLGSSPTFGSQETEQLNRLSRLDLRHYGSQPFASAPVRSKPRRTYDPARPTPDPEGDHVPMYLANLFSQDKLKWEDLKEKLERYGKSSGLFSEVSIKRLGKRDSEPFQLQVRNFSGGRKGPRRNLIDVGYGVSQALPVVTELLRDESSVMYLLQQPEVHLHPSAQAALGSLFCQIASQEKHLVVETHSDHLINRVRMDIRDGIAPIRPSDVSILFFERVGLEVRIHSLKIDEEGNILDAPESYGKFFMEETARSLRL